MLVNNFLSVIYRFGLVALLIVGLVVSPVLLNTSPLAYAELPSSTISRGELEQILRDDGMVKVMINIDPSGQILSERLGAFVNSLASSVNDATMEAVEDLPYLYKQEQAALLGQYGLENEDVKLSRLAPLVSIDVESLELLNTIINSTPAEYSVKIDRTTTPNLVSSNQIINSPVSWEGGKEGEGAGQMIAILDTGVDKEHEFLAGKVLIEACFSTNSRFSTSLCPNGNDEQIGEGSGAPCNLPGCNHGTHVAGIAAGNNAGVRSNISDVNNPLFNGVARGADLMAVQVFSKINTPGPRGCGDRPAPCIVSFQSDQQEALNFVTLVKLMQNQNQAPSDLSVVNMSVGSIGAAQDVCDRFFAGPATAISNLQETGVSTVVAAGNSGAFGVAAPACIEGAVSVGNITDNEELNPASNRHPNIDIYAPGTNIGSSSSGNRYAIATGTSMSAPAVSGALAVLGARFEENTAAENELILKQIALPFDYEAGGQIYQGLSLRLCQDYDFNENGAVCTEGGAAATLQEDREVQNNTLIARLRDFIERRIDLIRS